MKEKKKKKDNILLAFSVFSFNLDQKHANKNILVIELHLFFFIIPPTYYFLISPNSEGEIYRTTITLFDWT
jgi:hypothetical protein